MNFRKITNNKQLEVLVEAMKKEKSIARGFTKEPKEKVKEFWKALAGELNAEGPPLREIVEWKKVRIRIQILDFQQFFLIQNMFFRSLL